MPDWIVDSSFQPSWAQLFFRLMLAFCFGFAINFIYNRTRHPAGYAGTFPTTLVLLCILIALATQVIGDNVARAFSLVGALSIVRFRTVVRDTKDTAFVIFSVVVGMAIGAGQPWVALGGLAVVGVAARILSDRNQSALAFGQDTLLTIRLSWSPTLEGTVLEMVGRYTTEIDTIAVATVRQGAHTDVTYRVRLRPTARATEFVAELNRIEGVHTVELQPDKISN